MNELKPFIQFKIRVKQIATTKQRIDHNLT